MMTKRERRMFELSHNRLFPDVPEWCRISDKRQTTAKVDAYKGVEQRNRAVRPIVAWDGNGTIKHYRSLTQCAVEAGSHPCTIHRAIEKGYQVSGYFYVPEVSI
jgi:hypothetical protein